MISSKLELKLFAWWLEFPHEKFWKKILEILSTLSISSWYQFNDWQYFKHILIWKRLTYLLVESYQLRFRFNRKIQVSTIDITNRKTWINIVLRYYFRAVKYQISSHQHHTEVKNWTAIILIKKLIRIFQTIHHFNHEKNNFPLV